MTKYTISNNHYEQYSRIPGELLALISAIDDAKLQALKLDGDKSKIYNNLAVAYSDIGDLEKTIYCYEQSLLLNPKNLIIRQRYIFYLPYDFATKALYKKETIKYSEKISVGTSTSFLLGYL